MESGWRGEIEKAKEEWWGAGKRMRIEIGRVIFLDKKSQNLKLFQIHAILSSWFYNDKKVARITLTLSRKWVKTVQEGTHP